MPPLAPSASPFSILQLGRHSELDPVIAEAGRIAFGTAEVTQLSSLSDAGSLSVTSGQALLAIIDADAASVTAACAALEPDRLPCWAVVSFTSSATNATPAPVETLGREDWNARTVARVFSLAAQNHMLRRANAQLRESFATFGHRVAHDLRSPLGGVLTTTEMLREVLADDAPANVPLTDPIIDSAEGLVKLIEQFSFIAKANAEREPAERLDMGQVFWSAYQKLESRLVKAGASLKQPSSWPQVSGHSSSLDHVWRHLLANAATHGRAPVQIEAGWSPIPGGHRFWLTSSGPIAPEKRATLFFPFHRLHEPAAPRGWGLPIVQRLVELDGGTCGFEERAGDISCFFFDLPKAG